MLEACKNTGFHYLQFVGCSSPLTKAEIHQKGINPTLKQKWVLKVTVIVNFIQMLITYLREISTGGSSVLYSQMKFVLSAQMTRLKWKLVHQQSRDTINCEDSIQQMSCQTLLIMIFLFQATFLIVSGYIQLCPKSSLNDANELTSKENTNSDISYILDEAETMTNFSYGIRETKSTSPDNLVTTGDEVSNKVDSDMTLRHVVELSAKEFQKSKEEIERHQRRLLKNLDDLSLKITKKGDIERDGNCFFSGSFLSTGDLPENCSFSKRATIQSLPRTLQKLQRV